jgi:hypothetical protein
MTMQAWWTEQASLWFVLLAVSGPLVPPLVWLANRGRHRQGVMRTWTGVIVTYSIITAAGAIAVLTGQPKHVWIALVYPGFFTAAPYAALYHVMKNKYTESELRKARARDL